MYNDILVIMCMNVQKKKRKRSNLIETISTSSWMGSREDVRIMETKKKMRDGICGNLVSGILKKECNGTQIS